MSMSSKSSLFDQLIAAFALMTIIPLLSMGYFLVVYLLPNVVPKESLFLVILIDLVLAMLGYCLLYKNTKSIFKMTRRLEQISQGDITQRIEINNEAELDRMGEALNSVLQKIQEHKQDLERLCEWLKETNSYTNNIIDTMPEALIVTDPESIIRHVNKTASDLLAYTAKELVGKPFVFVLGKNTLIGGMKIDELKLKLIEEGNLKNCNAACQTKTGSKIPVSLSYSLMYKSLSTRHVEEIREKAGDKELSENEQKIIGIVVVIKDTR